MVNSYLLPRLHIASRQEVFLTEVITATHSKKRERVTSKPSQFPMKDNLVCHTFSTKNSDISDRMLCAKQEHEIIPHPVPPRAILG